MINGSIYIITIYNYKPRCWYPAVLLRLLFTDI